MKYIKVNKKDAEQLKKHLKTINLFDKSRKIFSKDDIFIPIINISNEKIKKHIEKSFKYIISNLNIKNNTINNTNQEKLKDIQEKQKVNIAKRYDILGNIAIIKPYQDNIKTNKLSTKKEKIAELIIKLNPTVKTVVAQTSPVSGIFRIRKFKYIFGVKTFIAKYKENNCIFNFDIRKTFFSNRLSYERSRIMKLVKSNENILVMFAGVGPFAIEIAKQHKNTNIIGIELNENAVNYFKKNIELNKTFNVKTIFGDVKKEAKHYENFADRIIVPMPKSSIDYLDQIVLDAKENSIVHIYIFGDAETVFEKTREILYAHAKKNNYKVKIIFERIVRPYSVKEIEIVVDFKILKPKIN